MALRYRQRGNGFTLVEVLIAAGILLIMALGILPLFTRAALSNKQGGDASRVSNFTRAAVEELFQLPFDSPVLEVTGGTEKVIDEKYLVKAGKWVPATDPDDPADPAIWTRTTTIRDYAWPAVIDAGGGVLTVDETQAGTAAPTDVVFKEIIVEIDHVGQMAAFGDPQLTLRTFKSK